jgi:hypothetical protein
MKIPVKGYLVHTTDKDSKHSHKLFITSWDGRPVHVHPFEGVTSFDVGHFMIIMPLLPLMTNHDHVIRGTTGPAIPIPNEGHIHQFEVIPQLTGEHRTLMYIEARWETNWGNRGKKITKKPLVYRRGYQGMT